MARGDKRALAEARETEVTPAKPGTFSEAQLAAAADAAADARRLLLLVMLDHRIKGADRAFRDGLSDDCPPGVAFTEYVPNEEDPDDPFAAGTVRVDPGAVTVRVSDRAAFEAWLAANYPTKLIRQPAGSTARPAPDADELRALNTAFVLAREADMFADGGRELWSALRECGYQLVKIEPTPAQAVVDPDFWEALEKAVKANAKDAPPGEVEPIDQMGLPVAGMTATKGKPKPVVTPTKDRRVVDVFAAAHRDEMMSAALPALEGGTA